MIHFSLINALVLINALILIKALSVPGNGLAVAWWEGTAVPAVLKAASPSLGLCGVGSIGSNSRCFSCLDHGVGTAGPCLGSQSDQGVS